MITFIYYVSAFIISVSVWESGKVIFNELFRPILEAHDLLPLDQSGYAHEPVQDQD